MSIKLGAALVTRSLHLNHNILSVLLFPSHLLHVLPHIHTLCKYSIFKFVYRHTMFIAHSSSPEVIKWMILRNSVMVLWKIIFLISLTVFKKVIMRSTNYITYNDQKMESLRWQYENRGTFCRSLKRFWYLQS